METKMNLANVVRPTVLIILMALMMWSVTWKYDVLLYIPLTLCLVLFITALSGFTNTFKKFFWVLVITSTLVLVMRIEVVKNNDWGSLIAVNREDPEDVQMVPKGFSIFSIADFKFEYFDDKVDVEDSVRQGFPQIGAHGNVDLLMVLELRKKYGTFKAYRDSLTKEVQKVIDTVAAMHPINLQEPETKWLYLYLVQKEINNHRFPFIYGRMRANCIF